LLRAPLLLCLCLILVLPARAAEPAPVLQGMVTWIYDGDTLGIDGLGKVRLVGIDVPEQTDSSRDRYLVDRGIAAAKLRLAALAAKQFNINQVRGQLVRLEIEDPSRDSYGRLLAYVYLPDGRLLNRVLLEKGLAVVYKRFAFGMKAEFLASEAEARSSGAGLWAR
jgi:micrococcal nuclease